MKRIAEFDYLKGCLILLVISFHLVYFEQLYPYAKQVVYTFHMACFLLLSGYLMNVDKPPRRFLRTLLWLAVPYLTMESGYLVMSSILPVADHVEHLSPSVFLDRLLLHPLGPYWYLHLLIVAGALYYAAFRPSGPGVTLRLAALVLALFCLSRRPVSLPLSSALYFVAGAAIRQSGTALLALFRPTWFALPAFVLLAASPANLGQGSVGGILIACSAICLMLWTFTLLPPGSKLPKGITFLGRNSLVLYVFSPIFTILCKQLVPALRFDPTGLLFLVLSLAVCIAGSLGIALLMDLTGISPYFFGKERSVSLT